MKRSIFLTIIFSFSLISSNFVNANIDKNKLINAGLIIGGIGFICIDKWQRNKTIRQLREQSELLALVSGQESNQIKIKADAVKKTKVGFIIGSVISLIGIYRSLPQSPKIFKF